MPQPHEELSAALDRFLEATRAAAGKRRLVKADRKYRAALKRRFRLQGAWFLKEVLRSIRSRLAESLREAADKPSTAEILELIAGLLNRLKEHKDEADLVKQLDAAIQMAYAVGAEDLVLELDISPELAIEFGLEHPRAVEYLKEHGFEKMARDLDATTADRLESLLVDGLENGKSYDQIAKAIRDEFKDFTGARADLIATTEIGEAYSAATLEAAQELEDKGIDLEKSWLTVGDDRVDEDCAANEDAGWIDLDDEFPSGDDRPLSHPGCRCSLLVQRVKVEEPVEA
jgi:SPP1 gp7 family putative phage head morphogenesis protein